LYRVARKSADLLRMSLVTTAAMLLAICLLAFVETTNTAEAEGSLPQNGKIAFTRTSGGIGGLPSIYTVEPDGSNLSRFTSSRYPVGLPSWSPDGTKLAFQGEGHITVMDADGSNRRDILTYPNRLGSGATIDSLIWSPDGKKLAFTSGKPPDYIHDIFMMDSDGSNLVNLTKTPGLEEMNPDFSPNGSQICFLRSSDGPEPATGIYVMNADGSDPTLLSEDSGADELDWSPDGTEIVFHSIFESVDGSQEDGDEEIYVINPDGSGRTALTSNSAADVEPDWSPDGKKITFASDRDGVGNYDIYTMDADGSDVAKVTLKSVSFNTLPDWLPRHPKSDSETVRPPDTGGPSLLLVASALLFSVGSLLYAVVRRRM
jgi:Tol biopolymer transport system component